MVLHTISTPEGSYTQMKITKETSHILSDKSQAKAGETKFEDDINFSEDQDQPSSSRID